MRGETNVLQTELSGKLERYGAKDVMLSKVKLLQECLRTVGFHMNLRVRVCKGLNTTIFVSTTIGLIDSLRPCPVLVSFFFVSRIPSLLWFSCFVGFEFRT